MPPGAFPPSSDPGLSRHRRPSRVVLDAGRRPADRRFPDAELVASALYLDLLRPAGRCVGRGAAYAGGRGWRVLRALPDTGAAAEPRSPGLSGRLQCTAGDPAPPRKA